MNEQAALALWCAGCILITIALILVAPFLPPYKK